MIWQLMKLDVAWRFVTRTAILFVVIAAIWHFYVRGIAGLDATPLLIFTAPLFSIGVTPFVQPKDARFQAILPVTSRQVFVARMLSTLALQWLPAAAVTIFLIVMGDSGIPAIALQSWSVVTCVVLEIQCTGIRGLTMRVALPLIALQAPCFMLYSFAVQDYAAWNIALLCCWIVCATVVARAWRILPVSFQLAPAKPSSASLEPLGADEVMSRVTPWGPLLQTMFPLMGLEYLLYFLMMCFIYSPILAYVLVVSGQNWKSVRSGFQWVLALPVPQRALLSLVVLPNLLSLICGYLVGVHVHFSRFSVQTADPGIRTQVVSVAFMAGASILANMSALTGDTHRVRRVLPSKHWLRVFSALFAVVWTVPIIWLMLSTRRDPVEWLSVILPPSLSSAIGVCALTLAALWWALEAMFRQVEFIGKLTRGRS